MNGAEAAASLFGSDDSSPDPFASLGGDNTTPSTSTFSDYDAPVTQAEEQPLPVQSKTPNEGQSGESASRHYAAMQHESLQSYDHYPSYRNSGSVGQQQTPNRHSADGHTGVDVQQGHSASANYWPNYSAGSESSMAPAPPQSTYDPYAPQTMNGTYMNAYAPSTSASDYSPYKTTAVPPTKSFVPQHSLSYTPATPTNHATPAPSNYRTGVPSLTTGIPVPLAPTPTTTITRPKVSNAYDPPFPPATKSKRVVSRSGPNQNVMAGYGSYQAGSTHGTAYSHQQPNPAPISNSETLLMRGMARQEYNYSKHRTVDNNLGQNASTYSSAWNVPSNHINGHHSQGNEGQHDNKPAFMDSMEGGKPHYYMDAPPLPPVGVEDHKNEFSPGISWHPEMGLESTTDPQTDMAGEMFQTSPSAHVSSDFNATTRMSSPEIGTTHRPHIPPSAYTQLSPKVEPVVNGNNSINTLPVHDGLRSPKPTVPTSNISQRCAPTSPNPYMPPKGNRYAVEERRAASPDSQSIRSLNGRQSTKPHPAGRPPSRIENLRGHSGSNGVAQPTYHENPYAPQLSQKPQILSSEVSQHVIPPPSYSAYESPVREVPVKSRSQYAPSPSLLGSNDPLGRTSARAPVISFGFGGKLVTCLHGSNTLNTGFDVALSSRRTTHVQILNLMKVIPRTVLDIPATSFPGPLFLDPGTTSSSLVRTGATNQKNKKTGVIKYLAERAEEISHGLGYLNPDSMERRQAEGKLVLVKLLKIMVENDGRLSGSASIDASVRTVLVPRLEGTLTSPTPEFTTLADSHVIRPDIANPEAVIAVSTLRSSSLDKIQEFLVRGERRQAYHYALDEKLWAHAMIIASNIDKEAWKEVVNEFLKAELGIKDENIHGHPYSKNRDSSIPLISGREALRMTYSLFSGQGSAAVQELIPEGVLGRGMTKLQVQNVLHSHVSPRTPNFYPPAPPANIPSETLTKWAEITAMMLSSTISSDTSSALTALGDQLLANQYIEAAHVCYLLAPQTSLMGGLGNPAVRIVLIGSRTPAIVPNFTADLDPIVFSEIVEYALSLSPAAKSQEPFAGLPHLQAYRFIRAISLAEVGEIQLANKYCEAITASLGRPSPYFTPVLLEQLKGLIDQISGTSHVDKSNSWMGSKIGKPSLDSIGGWLEGRFTKLVTGDADSPTQAQDTEERTFSGPFSTISSTTPSARSSPQPTLANLIQGPPPRSGSAMASPSHSSYIPVDRASSALDYRKPKATSAPRVASAGAAITSFSQISAPSPGPNYQPQSVVNPSTNPPTPKSTNDEYVNNQEPAWWGRSGSYSYNDNLSAKTPTATSFMRVDESTVKTTQEGFISLMDAPTFAPVTSNTTHDLVGQRLAPGEEMEDLGFSNTRKEKKTAGDDEASARGSPQPTELHKPAEQEKIESNPPTGSGSWLSRWWKREAPPGAVKASLGEESTFYYDKELKRWVNKKAGSEDTASKSVPPPPPSRAQTASPGMTGPRSTALKPTHSTSAIDLSTLPPSKSTLRVRSSLAPSGSDSMPSSPTGAGPGTSGPPPGRPKSQISARRNIRSRYVDVLQQSETGSS